MKDGTLPFATTMPFTRPQTSPTRAAGTIAATPSVGAVAAVRYLSVVEPMLAAEGANAVRAVVYALPTGGELHVPIEPRTDGCSVSLDPQYGCSGAMNEYLAKVHVTALADTQQLSLASG